MAETKGKSEAELRQARRFVDLFDQFDDKMALSTVKVLLSIATAELEGREISTIDVEKDTGLASGTTTRNIYYWANGHQQMKGGWNLITVTMHPEDRRKRVLKLTSKGHAFINKLKGVMD